MTVEVDNIKICKNDEKYQNFKEFIDSIEWIQLINSPGIVFEALFIK